MSAKNVWRRLANWGVMAFVAAVLYVFIMPSYRQPKTFPSPLQESRLDFPSLEEKSLFSTFGHLGAVPAWKRCQTWTVFKRGSAHVVVLS